jgi:hypothetical protein
VHPHLQLLAGPGHDALDERRDALLGACGDRPGLAPGGGDRGVGLALRSTPGLRSGPLALGLRSTSASTTMPRACSAASRARCAAAWRPACRISADSCCVLASCARIGSSSAERSATRSAGIPDRVAAPGVPLGRIRSGNSLEPTSGTLRLMIG